MKLKPCVICKKQEARIVYCGINQYFTQCQVCGAGTIEAKTRKEAAALWNEGNEKRRS